MIYLEPRYTVKFIWASAHMLTNALEVFDRIEIAGAFLISELRVWLADHAAQATGWNLRRQVRQVCDLLMMLEDVGDPGEAGLGERKDFMEWDRVYRVFIEWRPIERIRVNKYAESNFTDIALEITINSRPYEVHVHVIRHPDCLVSRRIAAVS